MKRTYFFLSVFLFVSLVFSGNAVLAKPDPSKCKEGISKLSSDASVKVSRSGNFYERREAATAKLLKSVLSEARLPKKDELAEFMGISPEELADLQTRKSFPKTLAELMAFGLNAHEKERLALEKNLAKQIRDFVKENFILPTQKGLVELSGFSSQKEFEMVYGTSTEPWKLLKDHFSKDFESLRNKIARVYARATKDSGRTLQLEQFAEALGVEPAELESLFGEGRLFPKGLDGIKNHARSLSPSSFSSAIDTDVFDTARTEALLTAIRTKKRILVTSAVSGALVHRAAFAALKTLAREKDAVIVVIPVNMVTDELDPILLNDPEVHILMQSTELSPWLILDNLKIMAKQKNPLEGTQQVGPRGQSRIYGSPKFASEVLATADGEYFPHRNLTTGAITIPNYAGRKPISRRTDRIYGNAEHVIGAVLLERTRGQTDFLEPDGVGFYRSRHIEFVEGTSRMIDLDESYSSDGKVEQVRPRAAVLGDIHVGVTNQSLLQTLGPKLKELNPEEIVLHDLFDGRSINHHEMGRSLTLAGKAREGKLRLEDELREVAAFVNGLHSLLPDSKITVVRSNHDMFLDRWLEEGRYLNDPVNHTIGIELALAKSKGKNPLEYYLLERGVRYQDTRDEEVRPPLVDRPELVHFLSAGQSYKIGNQRGQLVEVGFHGHKGANGRRGALRDFKIAADRIIFAHSHTEKRDRHAVNIGTSTAIVQDYNKDGVSSWVHSWALVSPDGSIQVIDYFDSQTYQGKDEAWLPDEDFFEKGYPKVHPFDDDFPSQDGGQHDQWTTGVR